jgi:hypothetical protein
MCCALAVTAMMSPAARADEHDKLTYFTFSGPVQIPGRTLAAGTYMFKLAESPSNRHIVQVFDKDGKHIYATLLAIPDQRLDPSDKPVVMFRETPAGTPNAVRAWFYPGNTIGDEFVYPKQQAMRIAKASHAPVLSMSDSSKDMKSAEVSRVDESGAKSAPSTTATASQPATTAPSNTVTSNRRADTAGTTGTSARRARTLPRTASPLALYELASGLAFAAAFGLRRVRR